MPSTEVDIKAALAPYAQVFASEQAAAHFVKLNPDLADVAPALLAEAVKGRLSAPEHAHFLRPPAPQYVPGSVEEIETRMQRVAPRSPGLGGFAHNGAAITAGHSPDMSSGMRSQPQLGAGLDHIGPRTLDEIEQAHAQHQAGIAKSGIGLGGQFLPKK
jgi:hypothetical protein